MNSLTKSSCEKTKLTFISAYYDNPKMLQAQMNHLRSLPRELRQRIEIIFVDDGSPQPISVDPNGLNMQIYRIKKDFRWNQDAARNIGAHHAKSDWLLLTDIDHIVPKETFNAVLEVSEPAIYTFKRRNLNGDSIRPHVNSFLIEREKFWQIGGYDEDYRGTYGTDVLWRARLENLIELPCHLVGYNKTVIPDANTRNYPRNYNWKTRLRWRAIAAYKRALGRGVRIMREPYDCILINSL